MTGPVHDYMTEHRGEMVDQLIDWVRRRSVAGVPEHDTDLLRSAKDRQWEETPPFEPAA